VRHVNLHSIEETIRAGGTSLCLYYSPRIKGRALGLVDAARKSGVKTIAKEPGELERLVPGQDCRGLVLEQPDDEGTTWDEDELAAHVRSQIEAGKAPIVVALDGVTDPHNLGAIIRSCDQFSVLAVVLPQRRSAKDGPVVRAASAGAAAWIPLVEARNFTRALEKFKDAGLWCIGADMAGEPVHTRKLSGPTLLVLGAEGKGVSQLVARTCDELVRIPTAGKVDSLNVSNAGAVLLYELRRQRNFL